MTGLPHFSLAIRHYDNRAYYVLSSFSVITGIWISRASTDYSRTRTVYRTSFTVGYSVLTAARDARVADGPMLSRCFL